MLEWRRIRVQSPGLRIRRRTFGAGLADMVWAVGRGNGRREGAVTTGASSVRHEGNRCSSSQSKNGGSDHLPEASCSSNNEQEERT